MEPYTHEAMCNGIDDVDDTMREVCAALSPELRERLYCVVLAQAHAHHHVTYAETPIQLALAGTKTNVLFLQTFGVTMCGQDPERVNNDHISIIDTCPNEQGEQPTYNEPDEMRAITEVLSLMSGGDPTKSH
jgi:hypothetical protein